MATLGLTPNEKTGQDVAKYIATLPVDKVPKRIIVHSFNPIGAIRMVEILRDAGIKNIRIAPFKV
jgi:hypothetical protein